MSEIEKFELSNDKLIDAPTAIFYLVGGLGNQLFILNYALSLRSAKVIFLWNPETCRLEENVPVIFPLLSSTEGKIVFHKVESAFQTLILNKMLGLSEMKFRNPKYKIIFRILFDVLQQLLSSFLANDFKSGKNKFVIKIGYFQDRRFAKIELIRRFFLNRQRTDLVSVYKKRAESEMPLIVHVRLGDYLHIPSMDLLDKDYYREAIELIWDPNRFAKIWVFSDSQIDKADYLPSKLVNYCDLINDENFSALDLLEVMSFGSGFVISNSTLSWWGAVLSSNGHSHVVAPHPWFSRFPNRENLYFENWIKIERKR